MKEMQSLQGQSKKGSRREFTHMLSIPAAFLNKPENHSIIVNIAFVAAILKFVPHAIFHCLVLFT